MTTPPVLLIAGHGTRDATGADGHPGPARRPGRRPRPLAAVGSFALSSRSAEASARPAHGTGPGSGRERGARSGVYPGCCGGPGPHGGRRGEPGFPGDGGEHGWLGGYGPYGEHSDHGSHAHAH